MFKINYRKLRRKQKIGETLPVENISFEELKSIFEDGCDCSNPYIIKQPLCTIEHLPKYYIEFCYTCMNCKWKSVKFRKRTI